MGISQTIYVVPDEDLDGLIGNEANLMSLAEKRGWPGKYLSSYWRWLAEMLTYSQPPGLLPFAALTTGELRFSNDHDGAHALRSAMASEFAALTSRLAYVDVRAYVDIKRDMAAVKFANHPDGHRWIPTESLMIQEAAEYAMYLEQVKRIAAEARDEGSGLLFCFWEDW